MIGNLEHQPVERHSGTPPSAGTAAPKPTIAPTMMTATSHHHATTQSEIAITISVGAGRSAPKFVNTFLNDGITNTMMIHVTTIATTITEIG